MSHTLLRQVVSPPVRAAALTAHSVMTAKSCPAARNPDKGPARAYSRDAASPQCHARPEERHWAEKKTKKPPAKGSYEGVMNGSPPSPMPVSYEPSMNFITSKSHRAYFVGNYKQLGEVPATQACSPSDGVDGSRRLVASRTPPPAPRPRSGRAQKKRVRPDADLVTTRGTTQSRGAPCETPPSASELTTLSGRHYHTRTATVSSLGSTRRHRRRLQARSGSGSTVPRLKRV
jgi:hypothetical protein